MTKKLKPDLVSIKRKKDTKPTSSENFYAMLKNEPEEIIKWARGEIKAYEGLIKLIEDGQRDDE